MPPMSRAVPSPLVAPIRTRRVPSLANDGRHKGGSMRNAWPLIALVVTGLMLTVTLDAARATTLIERSIFRGRGAFAQWTIADAVTTTFVDIIAVERAESTTAAAGAEPLLLVTVNQTDNATGAVLFQAFGEASEFVLQVNGNLSSARLSAALDLHDFVSGATEPFTVHLTFIGVGEVGGFEKNHFTSNEGGMKVNVFQDVIERPASATGAVSGMGMNFTPVPTAIAFIQKIHMGTVLVTKE
jgi:hypothetical protein